MHDLPTTVTLQDIQLRYPSYAEMVTLINRLTEKIIEEYTNKKSEQVKTIYGEHSMSSGKDRTVHTTHVKSVALKTTPEYTIEHHWTYCPECGHTRSRSIVGLHEETREAYIWEIIKNGRYV